jgi:hypothetical protein
LPLLAAVYEEGFYRGTYWHREQLNEAEFELSKLEKHWEKAELDDEILADLRERARYLRTALSVAREYDAVLTIT